MIGYAQLAEAARYLDAAAEEHSNIKPVVEGQLGLDLQDTLRVSEQRAMRVYALVTGKLAEMQRTGLLDRPHGEGMSMEIFTADDIHRACMMAVLDGIVIGRRVTLTEKR